MLQNEENRDGVRDKGRRKKRSENERTRSGWPSASDPNLLVYEILAFLPPRETSPRMNLSRRCTSLIFDLLSDAASAYAPLSHLAKRASFSVFISSPFPNTLKNTAYVPFIINTFANRVLKLLAM